MMPNTAPPDFRPREPREAAGARTRSVDDVPGVCELPLTRAVVHYRDALHVAGRDGHPSDIGLAVVVSGRFASSVRALDLGSGAARRLDLTSELVILDWILDSTLEEIRLLGEEASATPANADGLRRSCFALALRVLDRHGFTPLTRPALLRIGFRDICRDLDPEGGSSVRFASGPGRMVRVRLDPDANTLLIAGLRAVPRLRSGTSGRSGVADLVHGVRAAFPGQELVERPNGLQVRLGVPVSYRELAASLETMRSGLNRLTALYEPERYRELRRLTAVFGERATLERLALAEGNAGPPVERLTPLERSWPDDGFRWAPHAAGLSIH